MAWGSSYLFTYLFIRLASVWFEFRAPAFEIPTASVFHRLAVWIMSEVVDWTDPPPGRFKWTRPFRWKTKSGFCACAITFQTQSTILYSRECSWPTQHGYSPFNTSDNGRQITYKSCPKHVSLSLHNLPSTDRHMLRASCISSLRWNLKRPYNRNCITFPNLLQHRTFVTRYYGTTSEVREAKFVFLVLWKF
jgi:hypothetical protein